MTQKTVFLSAYCERPDGSLEFVDSDDQFDGWVVQLRTPAEDDAFPPFDVAAEETYPDRAIAARVAKSMAREQKCSLVEG